MDTTLTSVLTKNLLKHAAGTAIFCTNDKCRRILDCKTTVIVEVGEHTRVVCTDCWDASKKLLTPEQLEKVTITDGRDYWPPKKTPTPKGPHTITLAFPDKKGNTKKVEVKGTKIGILGVHRIVNADGVPVERTEHQPYTYNITHLPTGLVVKSFHNQRSALKVARLLDQTPFKNPDLTRDLGCQAAAREALKTALQAAGLI
jgi:hypothetical protein